MAGNFRLEIRRDQEDVFVATYLATFNAPLAANAAGLHRRSAYLYLRKPVIRDRIRKHLDQRLNELGITAERVLREIASIAFSQPGTVVRIVTGEDGAQMVRTVDSDLWPPELQAAFAGASQDKDGIIKLEWHDKQRALELLAKHLGLNLADDVSVRVFLVPAQHSNEGSWEQQAQKALEQSREKARSILES